VLDAVRVDPAGVVQLRSAHRGVANGEGLPGSHVAERELGAELVEPHRKDRGLHLVNECVGE